MEYARNTIHVLQDEKTNIEGTLCMHGVCGFHIDHLL